MSYRFFIFLNDPGVHISHMYLFLLIFAFTLSLQHCDRLMALRMAVLLGFGAVLWCNEDTAW